MPRIQPLHLLTIIAGSTGLAYLLSLLVGGSRAWDPVAAGGSDLLAPAPAEGAQGEFNPIRVVEAFPPLTDAPVRPASRVGPRRVADQELVLGVEIEGEARAYPINALTGPRREIINDTLAGRAIAATW